jgi:hypothetical protein
MSETLATLARARRFFLAVSCLALLGATVHAADAPTEVPRKLVEIYRIAPGQHAAFLEFIARCDEANRRGGLPPRELYVHSDGAGWDFMIDHPAGVDARRPPRCTRHSLGRARSAIGRGLLSAVQDLLRRARRHVCERADDRSDFLATRGK